MQNKWSWSSLDSSHLQMLIINPCRLFILSMEIEGILLGHQAGKGGAGNFVLCDQTGSGCINVQSCSFHPLEIKGKRFLGQAAKIPPRCPLWKHFSSEIDTMPPYENKKPTHCTFQYTVQLNLLLPKSVVTGPC